MIAHEKVMIPWSRAAERCSRIPLFTRSKMQVANRLPNAQRCVSPLDKSQASLYSPMKVKQFSREPAMTGAGGAGEAYAIRARNEQTHET